MPKAETPRETADEIVSLLQEMRRKNVSMREHDAQLIHLITDALTTQATAFAELMEAMEEALEQIDSWSRAYPLKIFPEPDFAKAHEVLKAAGMTIDAISASAMRHAVEGVGDIARKALARLRPAPSLLPSEEPVAWRHRHKELQDGDDPNSWSLSLPKFAPRGKAEHAIWEPLYTHWEPLYTHSSEPEPLPAGMRERVTKAITPLVTRLFVTLSAEEPLPRRIDVPLDELRPLDALLAELTQDTPHDH